MATINQTVAGRIREELRGMVAHATSIIAPPASVSPAMLLKHQLPKELLQHLQWLATSEYIELMPSPSAISGRHLNSMSISLRPSPSSNVQRAYTVWLRRSHADLYSIKAFDLLARFNPAERITNVYEDNPAWAALRAWKEEVTNTTTANSSLVTRAMSNLQFINTTGQLTRCMPALTCLLPSERNRASRNASARSPMPAELRGNEVELYTINTKLAVLIAQHTLTRRANTNFWAYC